MNNNKVKIFIYDLTDGTLKNASRVILKRKIEAIYHTSVVVYGREYFYSSKIYWDAPKSTPYGKPVKEVEIGDTNITIDEFECFLKNKLSKKYTEDSYNAISNNCNHFTNEAVLFLTGKSIPDYILNQHEEFERTVLGQLFFKFCGFFQKK